MKSKIYIVVLLILALSFVNTPPSSSANESTIEIEPFSDIFSTAADVDPFSKAPDYDSGWTNIAKNGEIQFDHNLGGNKDNYVVDVQAFNSIQGANQYLYGIDNSYRDKLMKF